MEKKGNFVPILSTEAGLCLTAANWEEVGVQCVSYYLDSLLLKPGLETLKQITNLKTYLGWSKTLVINARNLKLGKNGLYTITSPFDGSRLSLSPPELIELINHLKPDALVLPNNITKDYPEIWTNLNESIFPFVQSESSLPKVYGVFFTQPTKNLNSTSYFCGDIDNTIETDFMESNQPAQLGFEGIVYGNSGQLDLKDKTYEMQFEVIDANCSCPTCKQGLTKAYLHHLLFNTPLLCQRFLIQHNVAEIAKHYQRFSI